MCIQAPMADAMATGMRDFTLNSKRRSSITRNTAEIGVPNVADMPAAAPLANRILLSEPVTLINWPIREPNDPPVWMIGPSAPKGCPEPIVKAADRALRTPTFASILLLPSRTDSMASGMPCQIILVEPYLIISPATRPPNAGTRITSNPR